MRNKKISSDDIDIVTLKKLDEFLNSGDNVTLQNEGDLMELPTSVRTALKQVVASLLNGNDCIIVGEDLSTKEAARILGVSRPFLINLLETGKMKFYKVGIHRRISLEEVLRYKDVMQNMTENTK